MSKRCELQKEFYKDYGDYKGKGKYNDTYVKWLETRVINLRSQKSCNYCQKKLNSTEAIILCKECTE
jgi:hypothetical protein